MITFVVRVVVCALLAGCGLATLLAQGTRVTVVLGGGKQVDAVVKRASASDLVVEVDGKERTFPFASIVQVIVVNPARPSEMQAAFTAFRTVQDALAAGNIEAPAYATLIDKLKQGAGFASGTGEWSDIRMAMRAAFTEYESAVKDWEHRFDRWTRAEYDLNWARELGGRDAERSHLEDPRARPLKIGQPIAGRLGAGDRQMPGDIDGRTEGAFNDIWTIEMRAPATLLIEMSSTNVTPHLLLIDADGDRLERRRGQFGDVAVRSRVSAGTYRIWAGASAPREVGSYTLQATVHH